MLEKVRHRRSLSIKSKVTRYLKGRVSSLQLRSVACRVVFYFQTLFQSPRIKHLWSCWRIIEVCLTNTLEQNTCWQPSFEVCGENLALRVRVFLCFELLRSSVDLSSYFFCGGRRVTQREPQCEALHAFQEKDRTRLKQLMTRFQVSDNTGSLAANFNRHSASHFFYWERKWISSHDSLLRDRKPETLRSSSFTSWSRTFLKTKWCVSAKHRTSTRP